MAPAALCYQALGDKALETGAWTFTVEIDGSQCGTFQEYSGLSHYETKPLPVGRKIRVQIVLETPGPLRTSGNEVAMEEL